MIRFERVPDPPDFDEKARKPGNEWIKSIVSSDAHGKPARVRFTLAKPYIYDR